MRKTDAVAGGLVQSLGIWLAVLLAMPFVRNVAVAWSLAGAGLLAVILLGQWHQRRSRRDSAVGAFTGAVLWPALIGLAIVVINIVSMSLSDFE
ncbi:hypothetical protein AMIS_68900 [Actinoplanes missouriensis 431]|uniref:Uncharacterized protein n=1 Tax=Actinoplanes missouriensis (strain ATCC 14538 / DSM 43046 / CBS 188.64 / JCM 3121 / NBRC 102363 / NCIMB 12654 / NRRL B-3342 / UNCC 431) TaxID=512565 RepID=I0HGH3_ACTM4|nr:hypothetical protein [Actinoplanes missouriensis]BAL92110.1 hypothetical protein AMIS_68900 [Actinoplanes missouriensis 431]